MDWAESPLLPELLDEIIGEVVFRESLGVMKELHEEAAAAVAVPYEFMKSIMEDEEFDEQFEQLTVTVQDPEEPTLGGMTADEIGKLNAKVGGLPAQCSSKESPGWKEKVRNMTEDAASTSVSSSSRLSDKDIQQFNLDARNPNTVKKTKTSMNKFKKYLKSCSVTQEAHTLPVADLTNLVCNFLICMRKANGDEYEPSTLTSDHRAIDRYLKWNKYPYSLLVGKETEATRTVLENRCKQLKEDGYGNTPNASDAITDEQIDMCWSSGAFGASNPVSLQHSLYFYFVTGFGWRGNHEGKQVKFADVSLEKDQAGTEYLRWHRERLTKTRKGGKGQSRKYKPTLFESEDPEDGKCPVRLYKKFISVRPKDKMAPTDNFFLTPKDNFTEDSLWYIRTNLGVNKIESIMPEVAITAKLTGHITNHSLRKTSCSNMMAAGIPPTMAQQLSGHANAASLNHYAVATVDQQREMADIATGRKRLKLKRKKSSLGIAPYTPAKMPALLPSTATSSEEYPMDTAISTGDSGSSAIVPMETAISPVPFVNSAVIPAAQGQHPDSVVNVSRPKDHIGRLTSAAQGMLSGANISGGVSININYNVYSSSQIDSSVRLSPKLPLLSADIVE